MSRPKAPFYIQILFLGLVLRDTKMRLSLTSWARKVVIFRHQKVCFSIQIQLEVAPIWWYLFEFKRHHRGPKKTPPAAPFYKNTTIYWAATFFDLEVTFCLFELICCEFGVALLLLVLELMFWLCFFIFVLRSVLFLARQGSLGGRSCRNSISKSFFSFSRDCVFYS